MFSIPTSRWPATGLLELLSCIRIYQEIFSIGILLVEFFRSNLYRPHFSRFGLITNTNTSRQNAYRRRLSHEQQQTTCLSIIYLVVAARQSHTLKSHL